MSMQEVKRSLSELQARALKGFEKVGGNNLEYLIDIASNRSPSAVYGLSAMRLTNCGYTTAEADEIAKAVRWLAMIRRDHGEEAFQETLKSIEGYNIEPKGSE